MLAMNTDQILDAIDSEILRLQQVKALLSGGSWISSGVITRRSSKPAKKRTLSAEARAKIAEAQRKRWAAQKKAKK
jgi:hypothetical protein